MGGTTTASLPYFSKALHLVLLGFAHSTISPKTPLWGEKFFGDFEVFTFVNSSKLSI